MNCKSPAWILFYKLLYVIFFSHLLTKIATATAAETHDLWNRVIATYLKPSTSCFLLLHYCNYPVHIYSYQPVVLRYLNTV